MEDKLKFMNWKIMTFYCKEEYIQNDGEVVYIKKDPASEGNE